MKNGETRTYEKITIFIITWLRAILVRDAARRVCTRHIVYDKRHHTCAIRRSSVTLARLWRVQRSRDTHAYNICTHALVHSTSVTNCVSLILGSAHIPRRPSKNTPKSISPVNGRHCWRAHPPSCVPTLCITCTPRLVFPVHYRYILYTGRHHLATA